MTIAIDPDAELARTRARADSLFDRAQRLHRLTANLSRAVRLEEVAEIVIDEGTASLGAKSGALWAIAAPSGELVLLRARNYPDASVDGLRRIAVDRDRPLGYVAATGEALWMASHADYARRFPVSAARMTGRGGDPTHATATLPVCVADGAQVLGVLAISFPIEREFDADDRAFLLALASHCAQGFERARLYAAEEAARREATDAAERASFLVRASALLGGSLDYEETLRNVAALAVPNIGTWCGIDLVDEHGAPKQVAVEHVDPSKIELAHELRRRYPPDPTATTGLLAVLRTGASELYAQLDDELIARGARDAEHLRVMRELQLRSVMIVAIRDRGRIVGTISFVRCEADRPYGPRDLAMAEQLAERAGAAIGNAVLYEQAQQAIRARDEFLLIAGHELRTPLAAMALHHQAIVRLADGASMDSVRERGKKLVRQSDRMAKLVEDLLDVSRISAERLSLDRVELELGAFVREVVERMRDVFERAGAVPVVTTEVVAGTWDRGRLDQIVTNLLANAVKYGQGGTIEIAVRADAGAGVVSVTDHGIGIAAEDQERIFQRFERAVSSRTYGGLGLGLWIVNRLVRAHGGTIAVASTPGAGATFTVTLPL